MRAQELIIAGALWNTMVMCGTVDALWSLARTAKPHLIDVLDCLVPLIDTPDESDAIDIEPATRPATPAIRIVCFDASVAPTPIIRLETETIASFDPSTAARSQPVRPLL